MAPNRLTLSLEDSEELAELFANREPGEKIKLVIDGEILERTDRDVVVAIEEVEHGGESVDVEADDDDTAPEISDTLSGVVSGVMGKGGK